MYSPVIAGEGFDNLVRACQQFGETRNKVVSQGSRNDLNSGVFVGSAG